MSRDLYTAIHYILNQEEVRLMANLDNKYLMLRHRPFDSVLMLEYMKAEIEYQYFREYMKTLLRFLVNYVE